MTTDDTITRRFCFDKNDALLAQIDRNFRYCLERLGLFQGWKWEDDSFIEIP